MTSGKLRKEHNPHCPEIPWLYRMLIIGGSLSGKRNILLNLISHQPDVAKRSLWSKISTVNVKIHSIVMTLKLFMNILVI